MRSDQAAHKHMSELFGIFYGWKVFINDYQDTGQIMMLDPNA